MKQLKKAFQLGSSKPFNFAWASFLYLIFTIIFFLSSIGLFLIYFFLAAVVNLNVSTGTLSTQIVIGALAIIFIYFEAGVGGALAVAFKKALNGGKTNIVEFYGNTIKLSTKLFILTIIRTIMLAIIIGPVIALYVFVLQDYVFVDVITGVISLFLMFIIWICTTPAFIFVSLGSGIRSSFKMTYELLRREHINYLLQYIVFIIISLINLVPILQLFTFFFFYPVSYSSLIIISDKEGKYASN